MELKACHSELLAFERNQEQEEEAAELPLAHSGAVNLMELYLDSQKWCSDLPFEKGA